MIATLLNFSGEEAIKDFNTLQFVRGHEKKLDKVLEEFEWYSSQRNNVVFERQFWQITRKDSDQLSHN